MRILVISQKVSEEEVEKWWEEEGKNFVGVANSTDIDDHSRIFLSEEFSLISHLSQSTIYEAAWYVDNGASKNMIGSQDLFENLGERVSNLHMVLGEKSYK